MIAGVGVLVTCAFTIFSATVDAEHIYKKEYIDNHSSRWWLRLSFFVAMGLRDPFFAIASALLFSALFDQVLNIFREKPLFYLGAVASWDIFFNKHRWLYLLVKVVSLIGSLWLFLNKLL